MKKLNKSFFTFSFATFFLGASTLLILYKLIPAIFLHTVYYCQKIINNYSTHIPEQINNIILMFITFTFVTFSARVILTLIKIRRIRKGLIKNEKRTKGLSEIIKKVGLSNKVSIIEDYKPFAFCLGIKNPRIYISTKTVSIMTTKQLEAILIHEKYHLEHADSLTLFIGSLPHLLFPFFPLLPKLLDRYKIERELEADQQAVRELGATRPVIEVLRKLIENSSISPAYTSSIAELSTLEVRIKSLINKKTIFPKIKKLDILISAISLIFIIALIATPVHAVEIHANNQNAVVICLEGENCSNLCKSNSSSVYNDRISHPYSSIKKFSP